MALNEDATDVAYLLGRLFGAYVYAENSYQQRGAGLRDKYMGAASATPARVFPVLMRGYEHNLSNLRKGKGRWDNPDWNKAAARKSDDAITRIAHLLPGGDDIPSAMPLEDQGRFFIGFYHQFNSFFQKAEESAAILTETTEDGETSE